MTTELIPKKYTSGEKPSGDFSRWGPRPPHSLAHICALTLVLQMTKCWYLYQNKHCRSKDQTDWSKHHPSIRQSSKDTHIPRMISFDILRGPSFDGYLSSSSKDIHNPSMPYPSTPMTTQQLCLATHTHSQTNNPLVWPLQTSGSIHVRLTVSLTITNSA